MWKIAKSIIVGIIALFVMVAASLFGNFIAWASFALIGWWSIAAFAATIIGVVSCIAYFSGKRQC